MNLTHDRQGYMGDLMTKTTPQLKELLERQEKLLLKRKFLEQLPDKGEKTKKFAEILKQIIAVKSGHSNAASAVDDNSMKKCTATAMQVHQFGSSHYVEGVSETADQDNHTLESIARRDEQNVHFHEGYSDCGKQSEENDTDMSTKVDVVLKSFRQMDLGNEPAQQGDTSYFVNSYERIIKKAENNPESIPVNRRKFMPNRSLYSTQASLSASEHHESIKITELNTEESAARPPHYKFQDSKLISIEESVKLIQEQRAKTEELTAERAAKRLAEQLVPKMDKYSSLNVDMQYREQNQEGGERDSDDNGDGDTGSDTHDPDS